MREEKGRMGSTHEQRGQAHRQAILVLGMHRSGTSSMAGVLSLLGAEPPKTLETANRWNEKGYWESKEIMSFHDRLLHSAESNWKDWAPFDPNWLGSSRAEAFSHEFAPLLAQEFGEAPLFVMKDPRACRFAPFWLGELKRQGIAAKIVLPVRNPLEVAQSLERRDGMAPTEALLLWLRHCLDAEAATRGLPRSFQRYEALIDDWRGVARRIGDDLGIAWPAWSPESEAKVDAFLTRELRHNVASWDELSLREDVFAWVKGTYECLLALAEGGGDARAKKVLAQLDDIRRAFDEASGIFATLVARHRSTAQQAKGEAVGLKKQLDTERESARQAEGAAKASGIELEASRRLVGDLREELQKSEAARTASLAQAAGREEALRAEVDARDARVERLAEEVAQANAALTEGRKLIGDLREALARSEAALAEARRQEEAQRKDVAAGAREIGALQERLSRLDADLAEAKRQKETLRSELSARNASAERLAADVAQGRAALEAERTVRVAAEAEVARLVEAYREFDDPAVRSLARAVRRSARLGRRMKELATLDGALPGRRRQRRQKRRLARDAELIAGSGLFDPEWYLRTYPDVAAAGEDPLIHYLQHGVAERRNPNPLFDTDWYLRQYPDVAATGLNPLVHYVARGAAEKRDPGPDFSAGWYLEQNPDVAEAGVDPFWHFLRSGKAEGRTAAPVAYLAHATPESCTESDRRKTAERENFSRSSATGSLVWKHQTTILDKLIAAGQFVHEDAPTEVIDCAKNIVADSAPRISVIMPTWNRQTTVCRAIDSILAQSLQPYEIIISDDGSTDATLAVIRGEFAREISTGLIKIVENPHRGVSATRNAGMRTASGEIFTYLDSDNEWRKHFLLLVAAAFVENDELMTLYCALKSHDLDDGTERIRSSPFDRKRLLAGNFIDLNIFSHRKIVFEQFGGFDESLSRLVDWELIIRYTKHYIPAFLPVIGVDYFLSRTNLKNITYSAPLDENRAKVLRRHFVERVRVGLEDLRIAYFLYDFPALSQTFVMNELRWLIERGYDVKVYYAVSPDKPAVLDFEVAAYRVKDATELAKLLREHDRNICHSHFVYPGVTLFVWPACKEAGIHYTFMPHAVDIFHHDNRRRNQIAEVASDSLCLKVFVYGDHHKDFLVERGVPARKIAYNFQAVDTPDLFAIAGKRVTRREKVRPKRGVVFARLIEKKGIKYLLEAAGALNNRDVQFLIYGYGPLEADLKKLARDLGLTNVMFQGPVEGRENIARVYEEADFLVAPCVEATNGDVDGFPTVILEAMAAGIPVIATTVSAIPDYLRDGVEAILIPPADAGKLREAIERLLDMPESRRGALVARARRFLDAKVGANRTMETLLDIWKGYAVDLMLVTYNTSECDDRQATYEIVRRLLDRTTTPFTLTIVDNASDLDFWNGLVDVVRGNSNVRLIRKQKNQFCGPASNIAMSMGTCEFVVYICSKEGFVKDHGWERVLVRRMRADSTMVMAGHKVHLPKFTYGAELARHPEFLNFRNQDYARENPTKPFKHVQGGIFIARRNELLELGGFNIDTPQGNMDVEMSYFLESEGRKLGEIPEIASITTKTLPRLSSILDEGTVVAHPLTLEGAASELDALKQRGTKRCNICGWRGDAFQSIDPSEVGNQCPRCGSTSFGRAMYRVLANDHRTHRGGACAILSDDMEFGRALTERMFHLEFQERTGKTFLAKLEQARAPLTCIILDDALLEHQEIREVLALANDVLETDGEILITDGIFEDGESLISGIESVLAPGSNTSRARFILDYVDTSSELVGFDWRRVARLTRHTAEVAGSEANRLGEGLMA